MRFAVLSLSSRMDGLRRCELALVGVGRAKKLTDENDAHAAYSSRNKRFNRFYCGHAGFFRCWGLGALQRSAQMAHIQTRIGRTIVLH